MKITTWWLLAVIVVGALAGVAVVGSGTSVTGDITVPLNASTTTVVVVESSVPSSPPALPSPPPTISQTSARIVLAVTSVWDEADIEEIRAALTAEGFTSVVAEETETEAETSRVRVIAGFEGAADIVLRVLSLTSEAIVQPGDDESSTDAWTTLDDQADVLVLVGSDLQE